MENKVNVIEIGTTMNMLYNQGLIDEYFKVNGFSICKYEKYDVIRLTTDNIMSPYCFSFNVLDNKIIIYAFCDYENVNAYNGIIKDFNVDWEVPKDFTVSNLCSNMALDLKLFLNYCYSKNVIVSYNENIIDFNENILQSVYIPKLDVFRSGYGKLHIFLTYLTPIFSFLIILMNAVEKEGFVFAVLPPLIAVIILIKHLLAKYSKKLFAVISLIFNILVLLFFVLLAFFA